MPTIYPHELEPESYPEYSRRHVQVPTWNTFGGVPQFTILRSFTQELVANRTGNIRLTDIREKLDAYVDRFRLGTVVWPHTHTVWAENFPDLVEEIRRRGLYLFDIWSYRPGYMRNGTLSNWRAPAGMPAFLVERLGDRFLGFDNGEQDGRYVSQYAVQQCPSGADRRRQYLHFHRHFRQLWDNIGNHIATLISLCYVHYFLKEGNHLIAGAETAQGLPNSQIYYAFIRGAGKQYGVHWFGNASVWNRWGWKVYFKSDEAEAVNKDGRGCGPRWGTSLSLMKRLLYTHWMYDCVLLGFENGWFRRPDPEDVLRGEFEMGTDLIGPSDSLSPLGEIQAAAKRFVETHGRAGSMHAPVAVLLDFFAGWTMPRHLYADRVYQVWGARPYDVGDHLTHAILSLLYPGYEDSGFYEDERAFLSDTPYGDCADCVLSDVSAAVLARYSLIIVAGLLTGSLELADKLRAAARDGATVFMTAENAKILYPEWNIADLCMFSDGTTVSVAGNEITERRCFELYRARRIPRAEEIAECEGEPAIVSIEIGTGRMIVSLSPFGLNSEPIVKGRFTNEVNRSLPRPYDLLDHVRAILHQALIRERIFSVGEGLGYTVARKTDGAYHIAVYNNSNETRTFQIVSHAGELLDVVELKLDQSEKSAVGYRPRPFLDDAMDAAGADSIAAGDIRVFQAEIREASVRLMRKPDPRRPPARTYMRIGVESTIEDAILCMPTFFDYFSGILVDWRFLESRDRAQLERDAAWLFRQRCDVIIDFSSGCNLFPDFAFLDSAGIPFYETMERLRTLFEKCRLLGCARTVFSLHRGANAWSDRRLSHVFGSAIRDLCAVASTYGVDITLQHHPRKWPYSAERTFAFVSEVARPGLEFGLNVGHVRLGGESVSGLADFGRGICRMVLLSMPQTDRFGQRYDVHAPVSGRSASNQVDVSDALTDEEASTLREFCTNRTVVFDADYASWDEVYRDLQMINADA